MTLLDKIVELGREHEAQHGPPTPITAGASTVTPEEMAEQAERNARRMDAAERLAYVQYATYEESQGREPLPMRPE